MPIPTTQGRVGWGAHCRVRGTSPCATSKRHVSATSAIVVGVLLTLWVGLAAQAQSSIESRATANGSARGPRVVDVRGAASNGTAELGVGEGAAPRPDATADRVDDGAPPDPAPTPPTPPTPTQPAIAGPETLGTTRVDVEALRKRATESTELDAEGKQTVERLTSEALADLERIDQLKQRAAQFQADADGVEARVAAMRGQLSQLQYAQPDPPLQLGLSELEQEVSRRELELPQLKTALAKAETAPSARAGRRREIREQLLSANQRLAELQQQLDAKPIAEEPALVTTAKRTLLTIRRRLIEAEQPALQSELAKYDAEDAADFLRLNTDVATQQVRLASAELEQLQTLLASRREADSAAALAQAEQAALAAPPELRDQADSIVEIAAAAHELAKPIDDARQLLDRTRARHEEVQRQFVTTRQRVDNIGLSGAVGPLLWRKRGELPNLAKRRQNVSERGALIETVQFQLYEYVDLRSESIEETTRKMLDAVEEATRKNLQKKLKEIAPARWELLENEAREFAEQRRDRLDAVIRSQNAYLDLLFELDGTEQLLIRETERFEQYIDERVLWVPGHRSLLTNFAVEPTDAWPLRPDKWLEVGTQLSKDLRLFPASYFFAGILITALVWRRRKFRRQLDECGQAAARANCVRFVPTLQAAFVTSKLSLAIPGALLFLAWRLSISSDGSDFTRAVSQALYAVSWVFFPLEFLRRACRPRGLADSHFGWSSTAIAFVRSKLRWVAPVGLLFVFITSLLGGSHAEQGVDAIERVCFVLGMTLLGTQLYRAFRPESPLLRAYLADHPSGWSERLSHVWSWVALAAPLSFAGLTIAGYYYTAQQLTWRLNASLVFLFVL
ncbi:MAG: hypothetical protein KDB14_09555, partial [Planctomycetales bacterium]|nr:hypothetical protein [Planctomycetales bacterium]